MKWASPTSRTSMGRKSSQPPIMAATRMGSGEMGVTLKRRRILASRSCTLRIPAPHKPLPRMPITITGLSAGGTPALKYFGRAVAGGANSAAHKAVAEEPHYRRGAEEVGAPRAHSVGPVLVMGI